MNETGTNIVSDRDGHFRLSKLLKVLILSTILVVLISGTGYSTIRYVKAGNPTPVYPYTSWATASDSIQKVVDMCESGDTILIGTGIYREQVVSEHPGRDLAIIGIDVDSCIVDLSGFPQFSEIYAFMMKDDLILENLTFKTRAYSTDHYGVWISIVGRFVDFRVKHNKFLGSFHTALSIWSGVGEVTGNLISGSENALDISFPVQGLPPISCHNNVLSNCLMGFNVGSGLFINNFIINMEMYAVPLQMFGNSTAFYSNLILNNSQRAVAVDLAHGTFQNNIFKNFNSTLKSWTASFPFIFVNNNIDSCSTIFDLSNSGVVSGNISYNNFYGNGTISNDISKLNPDTLIYTSFDPMYEGTDSSNYRLQMYSPLIDAGDPTILDVDGTRSDIGRYGGPFGQRYEYLDLAPKKPSFTLVTKKPVSIETRWRGGTEADFNSFSLHRGRDPYFIPGELNRIYTGRDTMFTDSLSDPTGNYTYKITAKDNQGLVSKWDSVTVVLTDIAEGGELSPKGVVLYQNYPNPFNPSTTIRFRLEEPGEVILRVYDVNGSTVAVLNNGWLPAGEHERDFTPGKTGTMNDMASGVYFYNLTVRDANLKPVFIRSDKMLFVK